MDPGTNTNTPGSTGGDFAALAIGVVLIAIGAVLRFSALGQESAWGDELFSLDFAAGTIRDTLTAAAHDFHPPLYFLLLKGWFGIWGSSIVSARAFSAFFSTLALLPFWALARRTLGVRPALAALALFALSPYQLWYAQDARMYPLLMFLEASAFAAYASLIDAARQGRRGSAAWAALLVASAGIILTHFYFVFIVGFIAAHWAARIILACRARRIDLGLSPLIRYIIITGVVALPSALQIIRQLPSERGFNWIPPLSLGTFHGIFHAFSYGVFILPRPAWIEYPPAVAFLVTLIFAAAGTKRAPAPPDLDPDLEPPGSMTIPAWSPRAAGGFLWTALFFTLGAPVLVSIFRPIVFFGQRYEIVATIPFYLLIALGLRVLIRIASARGRRAIGISAVALILAAAISPMIRFHVDYFDSRQQRPFDTAAARLDESYREGDAIVAYGPVTASLLMHYMRSPYRIYIEESTHAVPEIPPGARLWFVTLTLKRSELEMRARSAWRHGRTDLYELSDIPGLLIRASSYERPAAAGP